MLYSKGRTFDSHRGQAFFQACPVWIYTQSNITNIVFTWVHNTNTEKSWLLDCIDIEGTIDSVPKYHILEPTWPRSQGRRNRGGRAKPPPSFQKTQKVPSLQWQSALCFREKCCSDCIFYDCNYFSFRKHKKCPLSGDKVPLAFVKNVVQFAFYMIAIISPPFLPPPVANICGKNFSGALFIPKVPLQTGPPPIFWCFLRPCA